MIKFNFISTDSLAPPIKQKARFKIKDAKCHLQPRSKEKNKGSGKQTHIGMWFLITSSESPKCCFSLFW